MNTKQLINGELVDGAGEALSILDPSTGGEIVTIAEASDEQVDAATAAAEPLEEPPGVCAGLCGFRVGPGV